MARYSFVTDESRKDVKVTQWLANAGLLSRFVDCASTLKTTMPSASDRNDKQMSADPRPLETGIGVDCPLKQPITLRYSSSSEDAERPRPKQTPIGTSPVIGVTMVTVLGAPP